MLELKETFEIVIAQRNIGAKHGIDSERVRNLRRSLKNGTIKDETMKKFLLDCGWQFHPELYYLPENKK